MSEQEMERRPPTVRADPPRYARGAWIAYYPDWSAFVIFNDELKALRHAVENHMSAMFCPFGQDPRHPQPPEPPGPPKAPKRGEK